MFKLIPKEERFFDLFEQLAELVLKASTTLHEAVNDYRSRDEVALPSGRVMAAFEIINGLHLDAFLEKI